LSIGAITGSGSTANLIDAIRAARAGAVAAAQAVNNQLDHRVDAEVEEQFSSQQQVQATEARAEQRRQTLDADRQEQQQSASPRPSSAYLTQALAQEQEQDASSEDGSTASVAGSATYANTAYADAASRASALSGKSRGQEFEILSPNPSASSGRGVDLTV
jgi:hypothetical protein